MNNPVTSTSRRNFYNMLSPPDGQVIASNAGILPSSEDVFEEEERDILRSWAYLTTSGIVDSLSDAADWMSEIMVDDAMLPEGVDDDEMIRRLAARILAEGGYSVLKAGSVLEAKQLIKEHSGELDLVITDLMMPVSSGRMLTEWLAKERPGVSVILMSGLGERVQEEGVVFLEKPFRKEDLLKKVRATINP